MRRSKHLPFTATWGRWARGAALCLRMTRPGFLVMTAVGCLVGLASAHGSGVALSQNGTRRSSTPSLRA